MYHSVGYALLCLLALAHSTLAQAPSIQVKHDGAVQALAWSADGKRLASTSEDGVILVTEFPSGKEFSKLNTGTSVTGLVFSADGKMLGIKSGLPDGPLSVWDVATHKKLKQLAFNGYS